MISPSISLGPHFHSQQSAQELQGSNPVPQRLCTLRRLKGPCWCQLATSCARCVSCTLLDKQGTWDIEFLGDNARCPCLRAILACFKIPCMHEGD